MEVGHAGKGANVSGLGTDGRNDWHAAELLSLSRRDSDHPIRLSGVLTVPPT
jgi:hypothetical protein